MQMPVQHVPAAVHDSPAAEQPPPPGAGGWQVNAPAGPEQAWLQQSEGEAHAEPTP